MRLATKLCLALIGAAWPGTGVAADAPWRAFVDGRFAWKASEPLIDPGPGRNAADPHLAIKDPSVVFHDGRWHLFATRRQKSGKVGIEYLAFRDWSEANASPRHDLALHDQYYCAPQIFFFTPQQRWYLIYQLADSNRTPAFGPFFSTTTNVANPHSWSRPALMVTNAPAKPKWLDFWVICDATNAHLFYTSLDGHLWRRDARKSDFPLGWSEPRLALEGDIFEASHTYKLKGLDRYLTIIEAQGGGRRYYKAYLADRLDGPWRGLADTAERPFAAVANVAQDTAWTANISHGELLRCGVDEFMEVDPANVRFLFQGASDAEYRGPGYGGIPWRLGLLEMQR